MVVNRTAADLARGRTLRGDLAPINDEGLMLMLRLEINYPGADPDELTHWLREKIASSPVAGKAPGWVTGDRRADAWSVLDNRIAIPRVWIHGELVGTVVLGRDRLRLQARHRRRR